MSTTSLAVLIGVGGILITLTFMWMIIRGDPHAMANLLPGIPLHQKGRVVFFIVQVIELAIFIAILVSGLRQLGH